MGVKTPAGSDLDTFWATLLAGHATAARIQRFDPGDLPVQFGCEVADFDPVPYLGPKESRRMDRATQLGFAAAADALTDAGDIGGDPARCAVMSGTGIGGLSTMEDGIETYITRGASRISPFFIPMMMPNATAGVISMHYGFTGPNLCITTACAAGSNAIGEAARLIREGSADLVVAGGTEAPITPVSLAAFGRMGALSGRNDDPSHASRPFDADRDGFVIGEGAAYLVLERLDRAQARNARIYAEFAGYGRNADAYHITAPSPGGSGAAACMQLALDDARSRRDRDRARQRARDLDTAERCGGSRGRAQGVRRRPTAGHVGEGRHRPPRGRGRGDRGGCRDPGGRAGTVPPTANFERIGDDIASMSSSAHRATSRPHR